MAKTATRVAIIGFGVEGQSAWRYWRGLGADITVCDASADAAIPEDAAAQLGNGYLRGLDEFDIIVRSAGIHPDVILRENPGVGNKITTVVNEFFRVSPTANIIGVTGTKGKGTTSTLIARMLEAAGKRAFLGGNIGVSPLDFLPDLDAAAWVVLELSSFQLYDLQASPHIGVCLMVVPEHLNWHADMPDYARAKQQLFARQTARDIAIYYADSELSRDIAAAGQGRKIPYFAPPGAFVHDGRIVIGDREICRTGDLKLLGRHNWQNACAAVTAAWNVTQDARALRRALTAFTGLPHRLELVREHGGVRYYDDSFATAPEAAAVALEAFAEPKVIILGGADKGASFAALARAVQTGNVRHAVLIGNTAPAIQKALAAAGFQHYSPGGTTMRAIVETARAHARPGDIVLLSPACASFGLFKDYKNRGDQFRAAVQAL